MRSALSRCLAIALSVALATWPTTAKASIFGEENAALGQLVTQGVAQIAQVADAIATAKEQLELARDVYAGVNDFLQFDPQAFLNGQKQQWMYSIPLAAEVQDLVTDVSTNGLNGGSFDARRMAARFDVYRDQMRRQSAQKAMGGTLEPYDAKAALTLSRETDAVLGNASARARLANRPEPETISDGLFAADAARVDPQLLALYMQRRAVSKEAEYQAMKLYAEASDASPGKAQQLAAMAAGMSAQELARIDDKLSQQLTLEELQYQQEAAAKANERREVDFIWTDLHETTIKTYAPPTRGSDEWVEF